ncbi:pre-mRNA splicing protein [Thecamonas trahens ATCC 50062]|uniref:Pre-mRNA splicing protein n=1 Tax=Thecamonas trahens ATCC 50062 TaxID=461836 RepID=A0A0L0DEU3_THETB|nr:pre-mRNA splicing protein [Thecamonas trahens ATCC 50062]KNC50661.1 pre-mRNA splicing protein [Thecamonas trahens ATCC 50062]|eukprot:XP_013762541.1 pre-mRNA splicing protein [Thecamonas trahens ATCC 50062]
MSYMLPHLGSGWAVDQAIVTEEEKVVIIRWGHDWSPECMAQDEILARIADKVSKFAVIYVVDISEVPEFTVMYELVDSCTIMFFYRNRHILVDVSSGNNNKINFLIEDEDDLISIIEAVYVAATQGKGLAVSPIDYSTRYRY